MKFGLIVAAGLAICATGVSAQQGIEKIAVHTDWGVFKASSAGSDYADCWSAAEPSQTVNTKGGQVVSVRRGDIQLMVAYASGNASPSLAFTGGYPYGDGTTVRAVVDGTSFTLMTRNQADASGEATGWAWPRDPADEPKIIAAMKRGAEAVLTGQSSRGTKTEDTFSLLGFTAAMESAKRACSG